jgi:hypothetical protein
MPIQPPPGFIDHFPRRVPFESPDNPPEPYTFTIEVLLPGGEVGTAVWTGKLWWAWCGEVKPLGWRPVQWCSALA